MKESTQFLALCSSLNRRKIDYLIAGGFACALHGHVRATADIDLLVKDTDDNLNKVLDLIHELYPHIEEKITIQDIRDNVVLKILDEPELDISLKAWTVDYEEALSDKKTVVIEGVEIPYMGLDSLIKSKKTLREIDQWDVRILSQIKKD